MPEPSLLWCVAREGERYQVQKVGWEQECVEEGKEGMFKTAKSILACDYHVTGHAHLCQTSGAVVVHRNPPSVR